MNFLRLNIFFLTSTSEWMNMNTFILNQKEPWIHLLILIFIFIWTMFTYTHTQAHRQTHEWESANIFVIYLCVHLFIATNHGWLTLSRSVSGCCGHLLWYLNPLSGLADNTLCSKLNFNIATVRQWSLGNNVCYAGFASCVHLLELRWGINKSTFISCLLPECRQQTVVKPHCPTLLKLKTGLPLSISFFLFSVLSLSLCSCVWD